MKQVIPFLTFLSLSFFIQAQVALEKPAQFSEIQFLEETFNFGEIVEGEVVQNVFEFENTSDVPLIISNAKGSCGCTVPEWPREPIMPGEKASILVQFNSKSKKGNTSKRISITANTIPAITYLTLKGKILTKEDAAVIAEKRDKEEKDQLIDPSTLVLFPNPSSSVLNVDITEHKGKAATLTVFDGNGKAMLSRKVDSVEDAIQINVTELPSAVYTLSVKVEGMQRLAKQFLVVAM